MTPRTPAELGRLHGEAFAQMAIDLRLKGLPVDVWCEYMIEKMIALSKVFNSSEDARAWSDACLQRYQEIIDGDIYPLIVLLEPEGTA